MMWSHWQYPGHVEPVRTIARNLPIPWVVEPEVPMLRAGLPTALLVTACFLVPTPPAVQQGIPWVAPQDAPVAVSRLVTADTGAEWTPRTIAHPVDWLPLLEVPRVDPRLVDVSTGGEFLARTIARDLPILWYQPVAEPRIDPRLVTTDAGAEFVVPPRPVVPIPWWPPLGLPVWRLEPVPDPDTGAERPVERIVVTTPIPWYLPLTEPVRRLEPVAEPLTGAERPIPTIVVTVAIPWAHQTEVAPPPMPPSLYPTGGEFLPRTIAPAVGWSSAMAEPVLSVVLVSTATGGEYPIATIIREVVDRRVADFPDRVGSRSNRPRTLGPI